MLGITDIDLKQTRFYQDVLAEGRQEGQQEGEARLHRRQLTLRFGPLPDRAEQQPSQATTEQLEAWALRVPDASSLDSVPPGGESRHGWRVYPRDMPVGSPVWPPSSPRQHRWFYAVLLPSLRAVYRGRVNS
jgi:Uncharacterized conserved protein